MAGIDRERLDWICERGILCCVLAIFAFSIGATGATRNSQFATLLPMAALVGGFWIVRTIVRQQYSFLMPPFAWAVLAFSAYSIWQWTRADIEYFARVEMLHVLLYAFLFFAIVDNLSSSESVQILLFGLIALAVFNSFYAIYQFFTGSEKILWFAKPAMYKGRASGTYVCPNHLAGFLEMVLPVALAFTITGRLKPLPKVFLGYATLVIVAGIGVTVSRGGYLSLGLSMTAFFVVMLWNRDFRIPSIAILILMVLAGSFFGFRSWKAQKRFAQATENNLVTRQHYWKPAIQMWKENPWVGVGPDHYDVRFRKWRYWNIQSRPERTHNDYLNTLADYGVIGLAIIVAGLGLAGWGVFRTWKFVKRSGEIVSKPSNRSSVVLGCAIGLLAIVFHSVVDFNMHIPANAIVAVALFAILASYLRYATERFWFNPGIAGRVVGVILIAAASGYLLWQAGKMGMQSWYLAKVTPAMTFQERADIMKLAFAQDSKNPELAYEIGEYYRVKAFEGLENYEELTREAMSWFEVASKLNKWYPYPYAKLGMCHYWLKEPEKAAPLFEKAKELDPLGFHVLALYGWHLMQMGDLGGARKFFFDSWSLRRHDNEFAKDYLRFVERRLAEQKQTL